MTNIQLTPADLSEKAFEIYSNSDFFAEEQKMNKEELIQLNANATITKKISLRAAESVGTEERHDLTK